MTILCIGRVSSKGQAESGLGMASQFVAMSKYIEENYGNDVEVLSFLDNGVSGSAPLSKREGLMSALAVMKRGDTILAYDLSRIARDTMLMMMIEREVKRKGGKIITVVGNNDDTPEGQLMRSILISLADYQRTSQNVKIKMALKEKAKTHKLGKAPYGYKHNEARTKFIEIKEEIITVRCAVAFSKEFGNRRGVFTALALYLNEIGVKSRSGGKWMPQNTRTVFKRHIA